MPQPLAGKIRTQPTKRNAALEAAEKDREKKISNIDSEIKRLNEEKIKLKEEQMEAKRRIKAEQQIQSNVDDWIREFCYCAGYVEDTDGTE